MSPGFRNFLMNFQDLVSVVARKHNMKSGFNMTRIETDDYGADAQDLFGNLAFSNRYTGFPYADFLLGMPTTAQRLSKRPA